jgi:hypothetical protein
VVPNGNVGEVDDHVRPLGEAHEETVLVVRREIHRRGEEPTFVADLPHPDAGDAAEAEDQKPRLAAVEEAEPLATLLTWRNGQVLPLTMIMLPKNSGFQIGEMSVLGIYGPVIPSKNSRLSG